MVSVYQRCHGQNKWSSFLPASAQWMLRNVTKVTRAIVTLSVAKSCACFDEAIFQFLYGFSDHARQRLYVRWMVKAVPYGYWFTRVGEIIA